ncbi:hypothetical protein SSX86_021455 [Deinandra increscens subsp. villosa]|uniref:Harbinger transposase-derived protein n=1 Tax=Deinandra increscens subsp. villosa TaxID=3103831 RepID=A0AAP0GUC3_9ASTR
MNPGFPGIPDLNIPDHLPEHIKIALDMSDLVQLAEEYEAMEASIAASEAGPSQPRKKRREINREREKGDVGLFNDYFAEKPVYHEGLFRRRYRMTRRLYNRIAADITTEGMSVNWRYFTQRRDAAGRLGLSTNQKITCALRQLAYGASADQCDEYIRIGESTAIKRLHNFCRSIVEIYRDKYLRRPTQEDVDRLTAFHEEKHGFPGMLGSIDCMHWGWRNCPTAWKGHYTRGDHGYPTIMLETVASQDLWIWHAFFGVAGSNNDINVINQSPLFNEILQGQAPRCDFHVNGNVYRKGYYLADGIYPAWSTLVKSFTYPPENNLKMRYFKRRQESARKDVERAFGVLQSRWGIIRGPSRSMDLPNIGDIMLACIILHNMIVEDEGRDVLNWTPEDGAPPPPPYNHGAPQAFVHNLERFIDLRAKDQHTALRNDLVEHLWANKPVWDED